MYEIARETALKLERSKFWETMSSRDVALFQLQVDRLCMPFGVFHKAVEEAVGHGVYTHEFADPTHLLAEIGGEVKPRTLEEVLDLLPAEKRVLVVT